MLHLMRRVVRRVLHFVRRVVHLPHNPLQHAAAMLLLRWVPTRLPLRCFPLPVLAVVRGRRGRRGR